MFGPAPFFTKASVGKLEFVLAKVQKQVFRMDAARCDYITCSRRVVRLQTRPPPPPAPPLPGSTPPWPLNAHVRRQLDALAPCARSFLHTHALVSTHLLLCARLLLCVRTRPYLTCPASAAMGPGAARFMSADTCIGICTCMLPCAAPLPELAWMRRRL